MERFTISKSEKQTIYEIYRACRICGAGGGYRMPIIQNIIDLEISEVELRQKIQDCLQLEVRSDDRMPPLICELCVDKVNDFYEFLELSRQTNIRTRTRLGLPLPTTKKGEPEAADCILGVTEPIRESPAPKKNKAGPKCSKNIKKETETIVVKDEPPEPSPVASRSSSVSSRSGRARRAPSPPRKSAPEAPKPAPQSHRLPPEKKKGKEKEKEQQKEKEVQRPKERDLQRGKDSVQKAKETNLRGIAKELQDLLQDNGPYDNNSLLVPRTMKRKETEPPRPLLVPKRTRGKEPTKEPLKEPPKVNMPRAASPAPRRKPGPKSRNAPQDDPAIPVPLKIPKSKSKLVVTPTKVETAPAKVDYKCKICDFTPKSSGALTNHLKSHVVSYTKPQHACNPCGKWFISTEEAATHHSYHGAATFPYHCRRCFEDYRTLKDYDRHIENGLCMPYDLTPDVKCEKCWKTFVTTTLLKDHRCPGVGGRPGGNCPNCSRSYLTLKTLKAHQKTCTVKKKPTGDLTADPDVLRRLKPMQVRISRCDDLLSRTDGQCNVARVKPKHGLDKNYLYPYFRHKPVQLAPQEPIRSVRERDSYTHWDSEDSDNDTYIKRVDSLTTLCLKKIFSKNMIGKIPRKKRKNDAFEGDDFNMTSDINDIISSLNDDSNDAVKSRKDSLISMAVNDIIGVPARYFGVGNEIVARSSNSVNTVANDSVLGDKNDNDNVKDLNDVQMENDCTDTVVSASDISVELNLIETENLSAGNDVSNDNKYNDTVTDDSKTQDDVNKNNDVNVDLGNGIRNFESVAAECNGNDLMKCDDSTLRNSNLIDNDLNKEMSSSDMEIDDLDSRFKSNDVIVNDAEIKNRDSEIAYNDNIEVKNSVNNDLDTQNTNHVSDVNDSVMGNDNLESENNGNGEVRQEENKTDTQDDVSADHLNENQDNDFENRNEVTKTNHNGETNTESHLDTENNANSIINDDNVALNGVHEINVNVSNFEGIDKLDENKKVSKESPIKHSIENLIGEPENNPDKYIDEVISSIQDIINKNPRNEGLVKENYSNGENSSQIDDHTLMAAIDKQIGEEKEKVDDKITLDDLLPTDNASMELDDISDEELNFDA